MHFQGRAIDGEGELTGNLPEQIRDLGVVVEDRRCEQDDPAAGRGGDQMRDWYKVPAEGVDPRDWRNTPDGQRVYVGKYWTSSPEARAEAGRALVRRLVGVVQRHPVLRSADVVVAVPGHDSTYLSFGERIGASVSSALALPLIKVSTPREFRPPAKDLPAAGDDAVWSEFSVTENLTGATTLIVDDVFRTGRTMSAVGSAVMEAGAARTCGLVAVRTMRR